MNLIIANKTDVEPLTAGEKERAEEALGQLEANVRHLVQGYDSEATESSSGGESCDEFDRFPHSNANYVAVKKRAKYAWLSNRADIASKWTWLTAQGRCYSELSCYDLTAVLVSSALTLIIKVLI